MRLLTSRKEWVIVTKTRVYAMIYKRNNVKINLDAGGSGHVVS